MASAGEEASGRLLDVHRSGSDPDFDFGDLSDHRGLPESTSSLADTLTFAPVHRPPSAEHRHGGLQPGLGISDFASPSPPYDAYPKTPFAAEFSKETISNFSSFPNTPMPPHVHPQSGALCPSQRPIWRSRAHWSSCIILFFSIFSTVFSGIYLAISFARPVWPSIRPHGSLDPGTASVLQVAFAKLIEMTFVTVCVAFIGQVISRRAFMRNHKGVNLAELGIRNWIMQPGSIIANPKTVRYAIWSGLGLLSMMAAICALLYTTAAEALVSPQLVWDDWKDMNLHGEVSSEFGNRLTASNRCQSFAVDPEWNYQKNTCLQLLHSGQSYSNYELYKSQFFGPASPATTETLDRRRSVDAGGTAADRKPGLAKYENDITVKASWVEHVDPAAASKRFGRIVNNFTIAAPHPGLVAAARLAQNQIPQPRDKTGVDNFQINASLPSPAMWVTCASASADELAPIIYENRVGRFLDIASIGSYEFHIPGATFNLSQPYSKGYPRTALDDVFGWGANSEATGRRYPPMFPKLPKPFNTVLNATRVSWGVDAIYMLANVDVNPATPLDQPYAVCSMKAGWVPWCSTHYESANGQGGLLEAVCDDPDDKFQYGKVDTKTTGWGQGMVQSNWIYIASEWASSLSWNQGITDSNASSSRLLSQLFPQTMGQLPTDHPSLAETIGVMGIGTLLMSAEDSSFTPDWPYAEPALDTPALQNTTAAVRLYRYASRPTTKSQEGFILILAYVFLANVLMLIWFVFHRGLVTDYTEPANLFSVAINSPPSAEMAGACGGGPMPEQYRVRWFVDTHGEHVFLHSRDPGTSSKAADPKRSASKTSVMSSPAVSMHAEKLRTQRWSVL